MFDAIKRLTANGYRYIGMDHFAKETDELSVAQKEGSCSATSRATRQRPNAT